MSHVHILGVECPDCGQVFVDANQQPDDCAVVEEKDFGTFKKPTIISRVVNRIFNPFSSPSVIQPLPRQVYQGAHSYTRSRAESEVNRYKRKRDLDEVSESGSKLTWFPDGTSTYSWKRGRVVEIDHRPHPPPSSYYAFHRNPLQEVYSNRSNYAPSHGLAQSVFSGVDSDRLNLKKFVQPHLPTPSAVRAWLDEHQDCDPIDSLLTPDLSCDCKNGKNAEKEKALLETAHSLLKIQKALEEMTGPGTKPMNQPNKKQGGSAPVTRERVKDVIGECSKTRLRILGLLQEDESS